MMIDFSFLGRFFIAEKIRNLFGTKIIGTKLMTIADGWSFIALFSGFLVSFFIADMLLALLLFSSFEIFQLALMQQKIIKPEVYFYQVLDVVYAMFGYFLGQKLKGGK